MKNSAKGFATILLLSLFPLILSAGLALFCVFAFLKSDLATLNLCRAEHLALQNKVGRQLGKLLKLNPRAVRLRLAEAQATKALALATSNGNALAIAAAEAKLLNVKMRRQLLDGQQRSLIETANLWLSAGSLKLQRALKQEWFRQGSPLSPWLSGALHLGPSRVPTLAVQADLPEVAPVYQLKPDFSEAQSWQQRWQLTMKTTGWSRKFLPFNGRFERECTSSIYSDGLDWTAKIKKDKSWSKGFL